jgi:hypothetical protein
MDVQSPRLVVVVSALQCPVCTVQHSYNTYMQYPVPSRPFPIGGTARIAVATIYSTGAAVPGNFFAPDLRFAQGTPAAALAAVLHTYTANASRGPDPVAALLLGSMSSIRRRDPALLLSGGSLS